MDRNDQKSDTTASRNAETGLGDGQGTRVGAPDQGSPATTPHQPQSATPAQHSDSPSQRPERVTGVGNEASQGRVLPDDHQTEHRSGYGGKGGSADTSSDTRP